jgi:hypothetical protein
MPTTTTTAAPALPLPRGYDIDLAARILRPGFHPRQIRKYITGRMCKALADAAEAAGDTETAKIARRAQNGSNAATMVLAEMVSEGKITMTPA